MGKKGKKSGSSSKKSKKSGKKGKKNKSDENPQMTWQEALLAYKINIVERKLEDVGFEKKNFAERNASLEDINEQLKSEQRVYVKELLRKMKLFDLSISEKEVFEKSAVIEAMKDMWLEEKNQEEEIKELKKSIEERITEISQEQKQVEYWSQYRDNVSNLDEKQIKLMKEKIIDENTRFDEIVSLIERTSMKEMGKMEKDVDKVLNEKKSNATEQAYEKLDKFTRQEIQDKIWLKKEVDKLSKDAEVLKIRNDEIETENIRIMEDLFDCTMEELQMSRSFISQIFENDDLERENSLLEMEDFNEKGKRLALTVPNERSERRDSIESSPRSEMACFIRDKVKRAHNQCSNLDDEESDYDGIDNDTESDNEDFDGNDGNEFDNLRHIGPLQLKLLHVRGHKIVAETSSNDMLNEEINFHKESNNTHSSDWLITASC